MYMDWKIELSIDRYNHVDTFFSDISNYKKEIHIAKYNRRGDVVMQFQRHRKRKGEIWIVLVLKGTLSAHAPNYVTSLVTLYEFTVSDVLVHIPIEFRLF